MVNAFFRGQYGRDTDRCWSPIKMLHLIANPNDYI